MPYTFKTHRTEYQFKTREERERVVEINRLLTRLQHRATSIQTLINECNYATQRSIEETLSYIESDLDAVQNLITTAREFNEGEDPI